MNRSFVTDRLVIGTTPESLTDLKELEVAGVTHIINCRSELNIEGLLAGNIFKFKYLWNPTDDWNPFKPEHKTLAWFQTGVEFALPVFVVPRTKVYVFCHMGANRSATLAWAILRALGITPGNCYAIIGSHRAIDIFGIPECGWWRDAEAALKTLGYL
jgi:hypothetical protein